MACRVLGMTSVSDQTDSFEEGQEYWNKDASFILIPSK
jgi:hypothetical protein